MMACYTTVRHLFMSTLLKNSIWTIRSWLWREWGIGPAVLHAGGRIGGSDVQRRWFLTASSLLFNGRFLFVQVVVGVVVGKLDQLYDSKAEFTTFDKAHLAQHWHGNGNKAYGQRTKHRLFESFFAGGNTFYNHIYWARVIQLCQIYDIGHINKTKEDRQYQPVLVKARKNGQPGHITADRLGWWMIHGK